MKIGIIHPIMDVIGGAEKTTLSLLDALKNTAHEVTLYSTTKNIDIPSKIKICHVNRNSFPIGWNLQRSKEISELFKRAEGEDLLFVSSGNLVLEDTEKMTIVYCHSTFESELKKSQTEYSGLLKFYHNYIKKQLNERLEVMKKPSVKLIANSYYTKKKIKELFGKESKVIFPPVQIRKKDDKILRSGIMTVARYSSDKNLEFNLDVIKSLDVPYKIFGNAKFSSQIDYYNKLQKSIENQKRIELFCNSERHLIDNSFNSSKVYFQSSEETFGISVIESITAGCIPIVPNNSANKESVPITELRFDENDKSEARRKISNALRGEYDKYVTELQDNIRIFEEENFQKCMLGYISTFEKKT